MKDFHDLACQHLRSAGYHGTSQFVAWLRKLERHSGREYMVGVLSQIATFFKKSLVETVQTPNVMDVRRFKYGRKRYIVPRLTLLRDAFGALEAVKEGQLLDSQMGKKLSAIWTVKHVYSLSEPTQAMLDKYNNAINNPDLRPELERSQMYLDDFKSPKFIDTLDEIPVSDGPSIVSYEVRNKRYPVLPMVERAGRLKLPTATGQDTISRQLAPLNLWLNEGSFSEELKGDIWQRVSHYGLKTIRSSSAHILDSIGAPDTNTALRGKISHLMESGCKDRVVAQPFLVFQALFEPLKSLLSSLNSKLDEVHVDDQSEGVRRLQRALRYQYRVHCFDCSSFTDRFPLSYQLEVLNKIHQPTWAILLKDFVEKGEWWDAVQQKAVSYRHGQPMGLGCSFALATLSHWFLLKSIERKMRQQEGPRQYDAGQFYELDRDKVPVFGIVGDDVFITHEGVAMEYESIMNGFGVEINRTKSLISNRYGEFCGVTCDAESHNVPFKPKRFKWDFPALVGAVDYYGKGFWRYLNPKSYDVLLAKLTPRDQGGTLSRMPSMSFVSRDLRIIKETLRKGLALLNDHVPDYEFLVKLTHEVYKYNRMQGALLPEWEDRMGTVSHYRQVCDILNQEAITNDGTLYQDCSRSPWYGVLLKLQTLSDVEFYKGELQAGLSLLAAATPEEATYVMQALLELRDQPREPGSMLYIIESITDQVLRDRGIDIKQLREQYVKDHTAQPVKVRVTKSGVVGVEDTSLIRNPLPKVCDDLSL